MVREGSDLLISRVGVQSSLPTGEKTMLPRQNCLGVLFENQLTINLRALLLFSGLLCAYITSFEVKVEKLSDKCEKKVFGKLLRRHSQTMVLKGTPTSLERPKPPSPVQCAVSTEQACVLGVRLGLVA